jgi:hypothetical protein
MPPHARAAANPSKGAHVLLAVDPLSAGWKTLVFLIAFALFVAGGVGYKPWGERVRLEALGLAAFVFPFFWDSWAAY